MKRIALLIALLITAGPARADRSFFQPPSGTIVLNSTSNIISAQTIDGTDNASITVIGGGFSGSDQITSPLDATYASRRGSFIVTNGNELSGDVRLETGNGSAASVLVYLNNSGTGSFKVSKHTATLNTDTDLWGVSNSGTLFVGADNTYNFAEDAARPSTAYLRNVNTLGTFTATNTDNDMITNTSDASDTKSLRFTGGGSLNFSGTRGSTIGIYGNEHGSNPGKIILEGGAVSTGSITAETNHASAFVLFRPNAADSITVKPNIMMYSPSAGEYDILSSTNTNDLIIAGGTSTAVGNGATIQLYGASSNGGALVFDAANNASAYMQFRLNNTTSQSSNGFIYQSLNASSNALKVVRASITASGASTASSNLVPAKVDLFACLAKVTTTITGATSFDFGDGSDVDRWGATLGLTTATRTTQANFTADPGGWSSTAISPTITANGSNFTGGVVQVECWYRDYQASSS